MQKLSRAGPTQTKPPTFEDLIAARVRAELAAADLGDPWITQDTSPLGRKLHCKLVRTGHLEGSKIGRRVLVRRSVLDRFIEAHKVLPTTAPTPDALFDASIDSLGIFPLRRRGERESVDDYIDRMGVGRPRKVRE